MAKKAKKGSPKKKEKKPKKEKKKSKKQLKKEKKAAAAAAAAALAEAERLRAEAEAEQEKIRLEEEAKVAAEMARLEEIRAAELAIKRKKERMRKVKRGMLAWARAQRTDADAMRRQAARVRLREHREQITVTVVEAKLWESHPFHVSAAVTITPGETTRNTTTLHGGCSHPVWHSRAPGVTLPSRSLALGSPADADAMQEPTAEGETMSFEIGHAYRLGAVPTLTIELLDAARGTVAYASLPLDTPGVQRRHFLDTETAAKTTAQGENDRREAAREAEKAALKRATVDAPKRALVDLIVQTAARFAGVEEEHADMVAKRASISKMKRKALEKEGLRTGVNPVEMMEVMDAAKNAALAKLIENSAGSDAEDGDGDGDGDGEGDGEGEGEVGGEIGSALALEDGVPNRSRPSSRASSTGSGKGSKKAGGTPRAGTPKTPKSRAGTPKSRSGTPSAGGSRAGTPKSGRSGTPKSRSGTPRSGRKTPKGKKKGEPVAVAKKKKKKKKKGKNARLDVLGVTKALALFQDGDWFDIGYDLENELNWLDAGLWLPLSAPGSEGDPHREGAAGKIFLRLRACGPEIPPPKPGDHLALLLDQSAKLPFGWCAGELDDGSTFYYPDGEPSQATKERPSAPYLPLALPGAREIESNLAWNIFHPEVVAVELKQIRDDRAEEERKHRVGEQLERVWAEVDSDGSGALDASELKVVLMQMGRSDNIKEVVSFTSILSLSLSLSLSSPSETRPSAPVFRCLLCSCHALLFSNTVHAGA